MFRLYEKISLLCKSSNVSIGKMCSEIKMSRGTISDLKMGRTKNLSAENLNKIANYFGTTVDRLISDELYETNSDKDAIRKAFAPPVNNDPELSEYLEELRTRPEMRMMFQLTKGATKEDVEKAVKIIETLLDK